MQTFDYWFWPLLLLAVGTIVLLNFSKLAKLLIKQVFSHLIRIVMTDPYEENLLELYSAGKRMGLQNIMELNLRSEYGLVPWRPFGSNLKFSGFEELMFDVAQLHRLTVGQDVPVDLQVTIGPRAEKPLRLDIPVLIGGMAYGLALSDKAKIALARGASLAGTATNSGIGPFLQQERDNAKKFILQYNRGFWSKDPDILRQADAIEIQVGQGSMAGLGRTMPAKDIDRELQEAFPIPPGRDAVIKAHHAEIKKPFDFIRLVEKIRQQVDGVPVGVKLAAGKSMELDLKLALEAGVDFITVCGAQAGTHATPPSIADSYALPTLLALVRARKFLEQQNAIGKVSLIIDGGFSEPGEMLKALALGADAVSIGTAAIFAISHTQVLKALPWEPPTQLVWYNALHSDKYDENKGAQNLANYLNACTLEMADGLRIIGKTSLHCLSSRDLIALSKTMAEMTGVTLAYQPHKLRVQGSSLPAPSVDKNAPPGYLPKRTCNNSLPRTYRVENSQRCHRPPQRYVYHPSAALNSSPDKAE